MSKKRPVEEYEKSFAFRFKRWMSGEKDPFIGEVEMHPQAEPEDPEAAFRFVEEKEYREPARMRIDAKASTIYSRGYIVMSIIVCLVLVAILSLAVSHLPSIGDAANPTNNEVGKRYIEQGLQETGSINIVTGMILTYRAFDTFGETTVLFIATCCVMMLIMVENEEKRKKLKLDDFGLEPLDDPILKIVARFLCPIIFMFGIYVVLNGHLSPGGGFSGGSIIGAGMILHAAAFGFPTTQKFFNEHIYVIIKVSALMCYGLIAIYFFYTGANGLPSIFPKGVPGAILSGGIILPIDICVGTEVACTIYAFYALFRRGGL